MTTPRQKLEVAGVAVATAFQVLKVQQPIFEAFLRECRDMENFGHITDPTLYNNSERKAVGALMQPLFAAAIIFIAEYEGQIARASGALKKVSADARA